MKRTLKPFATAVTIRSALAALIMSSAVALIILPRITESLPMFALHTQIDIAAPPATVWNILTDASKLQDWSPFLHRLDGSLTAGSQLNVVVGAPGKRRMTFTPTVLKAEPNQQLRWRGKLLVRGLFDGEHVFELISTPTGTTLRHYEHFSGLLVPLFKRMLERDTKPGFELMNEALKARAEEQQLAQR